MEGIFLNQSTLDAFFGLVNNTGGIPLVVQTTTTTNPWQFYLTLVISGITIFWLLSHMVAGGLKGGIYSLKLRLFKKRNKIKHILAIKHTTSDLFNQSMINLSTMKKIQEALIKFKGQPFDLILWTPGGEIFSATYISRMLKQYPGKIRSFVPTYSMSGGTMLALSTDEIYMNDYSCLGAVDPQLGNLFKFGSAKSWKEIIRIKGKKADDQSIAFKHMGEQYTKSIRNNLRELLKDKVEPKKLTHITELLTSGDVEHAYNFTKDILKANGMNIKDIPDTTNIKLIKLIQKMPEGVRYS